MYRAHHGVLTEELVKLAFKYTGRVSDLRNAGWFIGRVCVNAAAGKWRYYLLGRTKSKTRALFDTEAVAMEKLAVDEDAMKRQAALFAGICPWCDEKLVPSEDVNVPQCPTHGTAPFEPGTVRPLD